ncbi:DNA glycosylase AlkZ-like family protein [Roseomonas sp. 18066]|uniref:DNA glycosylase AlkZ-like family protein n=1 Tax=Roseomonas sp. 18066 TaxID=2681412 RepID=UPI00135C1B3D|nr:crosslink repair DNA glycosylase YcaQ family protein [Roseomonas sp. 18066]
MTKPDPGWLRAQARRATLGGLDELGATIARLGFVQADPIRAPARAQDLILRHRVRGYRAGQLERRFPRLGLEEDFLHAYGFMPPATQALLHPRHDAEAADGRHLPQGLAAEVLDYVRAHGPCHPRALEAAFGKQRAINGWGGFSQATTRALESLQHFGLLRVSHRQEGIRVYALAASASAPPLPAAERARQAVLLLARILAPAPLPSLRGALQLMARRNPGLGLLPPVLAELLREGAMEQAEVAGERYAWPAGFLDENPSVPRDVRILAPFDPIVWDRRRFAHLWGWEYRFEAYTPPPLRRFGYYALPLLWADRVIGWANLSVVDNRLQAELGFAEARPRAKVFDQALAAELARFEAFLAG